MKFVFQFIAEWDFYWFRTPLQVVTLPLKFILLHWPIVLLNPTSRHHLLLLIWMELNWIHLPVHLVVLWHWFDLMSLIQVYFVVLWRGCVVLWRGWCGTLKTVVCYFEEGDVVLWRWWCGTLKMAMWYFKEGVVVLWRGRCGTLKRMVWYFEEGGVVLWRGWCGTLKRAVWYFEEGGVELWRGRWWYFEDGDVVPWRDWCWYFDVIEVCGLKYKYYNKSWLNLYKYGMHFTIVCFFIPFYTQVWVSQPINYRVFSKGLI